MAQYRVSVSVVKAGSGRSPLAANAYICGAKTKECDSIAAASSYLSGSEVGKHDYRSKRGILHAEFIGPERYWKNLKSPDREGFWNDVVEFEKSKNRRYYDKNTGQAVASLAREHKVNLPHELPIDANIKLARAYALEYKKRYGVAGEFAVHAAPKGGDQRNIHFHFLHNERAIQDDGEFSAKKAEFTRGNRSEQLRSMREWWAKRVQRELVKHGVDASDFDHRTNRERGIKTIPTKHLGPHNAKLERAGILTAQGEYNRAVNELKKGNKPFKKHEIEEIKKRSTIARRAGQRKSGAYRRNREIELRKQRISRSNQSIQRIFRGIRFTISNQQRRYEQTDQLIRDTLEIATSIIEASLAIKNGGSVSIERKQRQRRLKF